MNSAEDLLLERAREVALARDDAIPSPCISVCRMSPESGLCEGCFRNLDEIAVWGNSGDEEKRATWRLIVERLAAR